MPSGEENVSFELVERREDREERTVLLGAGMDDGGAFVGEPGEVYAVFFRVELPLPPGISREGKDQLPTPCSPRTYLPHSLRRVQLSLVGIPALTRLLTQKGNSGRRTFLCGR